ncbi:efflux RND transporter permease subunit [Gracilibacillus sp. S3-1-1]|uniref:Efflux RND transporter permease subunit n=1 Tax=Gracilibacillus pellucidus TaxID=3095368 RepID=A0ACC6M7A2_9BACI|nr:efflux RND transporter permease subunit [Gracilibacillus sp. S3-1-1]MDX8046866.1 efflux RND transporter permease subunit [Gracilibacillus sp. S3-1-1]
MKWLAFIVKRKILVSLVVVLVLVLGIQAILKLDQELMPPINMDAAYVDINAGDMTAIDVEQTITNPLERQLEGIDGVETITSNSSIGQSTTTITLATDQGEEVIPEIENAVQALAADTSTIQNYAAGLYSTSGGYEFYLDLSGDDMVEITNFAEEVLKPRLENLKEVQEVALEGAYQEEIVVSFNRDEVIDQGIDLQHVIATINEANTESTIGQLESEEDSPSLRWISSVDSTNALKNLPIQTSDDIISLDDIADISLQPQENNSVVWKNGSKDFILVQISRSSGSTEIDMSHAVRDEIDQIKEEGLIDEFALHEIVAQADYVEEALSGVTANIIIGAILSIFILFLFLRNIRATLIIGFAIPTSILLTFIAMWLFDYSFNMLSLIGLGLGIGMMVDSSIVILESIYRKLEQGYDKLDAILQGIKEVATAVIASMLTTIVVFVPIGLISGEIGRFMIMLSMVVAITLVSSALVSFTVIPTFADRFLKKKNDRIKVNNGRLITGYTHFVKWIVKKKRNSAAIIGLFIVILAGSFFLLPKIPMTIMPDVFNRYTELITELEPGVTPTEKNEIIEEINHTLSNIQDVEANYVMEDENILINIINLTTGDDITREQKEVNEDISKSLRELQDTLPIASIQSSVSADANLPIQLIVKGDDLNELESIADNFADELSEISGIVGVNHSGERTSIEEVIELDEEAIQDSGLSSSSVKNYMEQTLLAMPIDEIMLDNKEIPIQVEWEDKITKKKALLDMEVPTLEGPKKLSTFIKLKETEIPNQINHIDGSRYITISAEMEETDLGSVNREVQQLIADYDTPDGYQIDIAGDLEQQQELMMEILSIIGIAIFLVYLVMAVQFNHLFHPIIVMSIIPMTIVGVILGLFFTQRELSALSAMGIIMLIGIVLNNAILFIDRTKQLRSEGYIVTDALVEAGRNRIRPIFMTSFTTAAGMLPLAITTGMSSSYQAPMATVIISGLLFATFITLLLIPAVYRLFSSNKKLKRAEREKAEME